MVSKYAVPLSKSKRQVSGEGITYSASLKGSKETGGSFYF